MKIGHSIDANGYLTGDVIEGSGISPDIKVLCPDGFYLPRWDGTRWVEGLSQNEIDTLKANPGPPTLQRQLDEMKVMLGDLILSGGI